MLRQSTLRLDVREFELDHYERLAEVYGANFPEYDRSASEWRHWDESLDRSKYYFRRYTVADADSQGIVGFGQLGHATWMFHPKKFWIEIWVDPEQQGRGIGSAVYRKISEDLEDKGAMTAWTSAKEDMSRPLGFLGKRGFKEKMRAWESRLNPSNVDLSQYSSYSEKAQKDGITISSLTEERQQDSECYKKLYELVQTVSADMPQPGEFTPVSYQQWEAFEIDAPGLEPDGYMIAKEGSKYVGLSTVWRAEKEAKGLYQGLTGVRREYRARGIAIALKLSVINFAQRKGYELVKTWNASINEPMLAINKKLGFKRQVGWITFEKNLG